MSHDEKLSRNALGRFATGVCVVSAVGQHGMPIGMTINSFSSASLSPLLVQWSLKKNSISYGLFADLSQFSISVLSAHQLDVSRRYAKAGDHLMLTEDYSISAGGIPYIRGAIAHFECKPWQIYQAGDHNIIVASVDRLITGAPSEPLVFYEGNYRSLLAV